MRRLALLPCLLLAAALAAAPADRKDKEKREPAKPTTYRGTPDGALRGSDGSTLRPLPGNAVRKPDGGTSRRLPDGFENLWGTTAPGAVRGGVVQPGTGTRIAA